jgi:hypothetical protein
MSKSNLEIDAMINADLRAHGIICPTLHSYLGVELCPLAPDGFSFWDDEGKTHYVASFEEARNEIHRLIKEEKIRIN